MDTRPFEKVRATFTLKAGELSIQRFLPLCFLLLFAARSVWAVDPRNRISQYAHTAWRIQDGVFSGSPYAVTQTTDGYLWIGTQAGLVRFDGVRFVPWTSPDGKHLPSSNITSLLGARDGSLWIGTEGGLSHWDKQHVTDYLIKPERINSIIEDRNGTVWFVRTRLNEAAEGGLCQVIGIGMRCYGKADGIPDSAGAGSLVEDTLGNLWIGNDTAVVRWRPGSSSTYIPRGLKSKEGMDGVEGLAANPDGSVWVGMGYPGRGLGLQQLVQGAWKPFVTPELDSSTLEVLALFLDRESALWIGTYKQGIYRVHGRKVDHFHSADGLSSDFVNQFYEDREGNLWVATSKGIDCFRDVRVSTFSTREGLTMPEVDSVLAAQDGTVWIGGGDALDAIHQGGVSSVQAGKGLPGNQVTSLLEDHAGRLWVGVDRTMSIFKNGRFRRIDKPDGRPIGLVVGMTEDVDNNIWVETTGPPRTLIRIHDLKVQEAFPVPQMPAARKVAADPEGGIWLGLMNGDLARYRHGKTEIFPFAHSVDSRGNQLIVNFDGSVLGATPLGLVRWKDGKQQTLTVRNGLPCDTVYALIEDSQRALWLYLQCGLVEIADTELQRWWGQPDITVQLKTFDAFDGVQPGRAAFGAATRSPDGRLWFANGVVLQMIDPGHLTANALPPPVHVEEVIADRRNYSPRQDLRLPPRTRDLEIDYTALSFVVPQKVRFRYKLEGRDAAWQEPGTRRQAFYSALRPGRYRFRVTACNNDGVWNDAGATLDFSVASAWYQTIWFRVSCIGASILLLWGLYQLRLRQLARQFNMGLEARASERMRIAREMHDTLLQSFQGLMFRFQAARNMLPRRPEEASQALDGALVTAEQAISESRDAIHDLRSEPVAQNDLAHLLTAMGQELASSQDANRNSPNFSVTVEGERQTLSPSLQDEVYRIAREVLRNAFRHARARHIEAEIRYDDRRLRLRIRDDGKGIDPKVLEGGGRAGHWGLPGVRERAKQIGARLDFWSEAGAGTEVQLTVPASVAYGTSRGSHGFRLCRKTRSHEHRS
jgi:signal transduction histidine kinase/ligand-binding sensor domain-containing protein